MEGRIRSWMAAMSDKCRALVLDVQSNRDRRLRSLSLYLPVGGVKIIADHHRMHALSNEISPFGISLLTICLKPDIVTGVVRHYVRDAIEDRGNEHQCQERPDFLHDAYSTSYLSNIPNRSDRPRDLLLLIRISMQPRAHGRLPILGWALLFLPRRPSDLSGSGTIALRLAQARHGSVLSSQFDSRLLDELAPFFCFIGNKFAEISGCSRKYRATQVYEM